MNHESVDKQSLRSLKSYSDLCCSGGFENRNLNKYFSTSMNLESISSQSNYNHEEEGKGASKLSNMSLNTLSSFLKNSTLPRPDPDNERRVFFNKTFSLNTEVESETLCFLIKAFRICALMLPPTNKRKLHLLLRFLYKLRYDQHSCKYLLESEEKQKSTEKLVI